MYLHLGQGTVVKTEDIIGIFDLDICTVSKRTRDYLSSAEKKKQVIAVSDELPKSFIVTQKKIGSKKNIYLSQISTTTLLKRSQNIIMGIK